MLNKLVDFVLDSDFSKFFIVGLVVAIVQSLSGFFSIFSWAAVLISTVPLVSNLSFFKDKLSYDQKQQVHQNSMLLSSVAWSVFMWDTLSDAPEAYTLTFVTLSTAALLTFNSLKLRLIVIAPVFLTFLVLLLFIQTPAENMLAGYTFLFLLLLFFIQPNTEVPTTSSEDSEGTMDTSEKMNLISEIDLAATENQSLKDKVKQAELELGAAEMAKMEFLATMSHEIRTPLNGIIPLLDILLDSELSDFQRDYLSTAHVSAIQMQKLIDDLLDYSKVEAGKLSVEVRGLKILRVLAAVNSSYQQAAQKKNIAIDVNIHHNVSPLLRGDPTRLRQVLSNLLSNAIKFSNRGTITLTAKKIKDYPNKEVVRFEVTDQGIGLDQETCDNIFLPFTQEDASSTRKFGGTGLGLAISKKIVELMNGSIYVESVKGKGSTFYFDLPLLKSMGETNLGLAETTGYQAILVNTNPLLFNKISNKLKEEEISFQKALGLPQAMEMYRSIKGISKQVKNVLIFIDFETAGKQVRDLCDELARNKTTENLHACILTDNSNIAGIPQLPNVKLMEKDISIADYLNKIEVSQASIENQKEDGEERLEAETNENVVEEVQGSSHIETPTNAEPISPKHLDSIRPEILLVEDNEVNLKVAEKLIQYIGYPFDFALNGQEALEKVKQKRYRMILMDCQMPVMDGYKCTSKIRDYEQAAGLNRTPIMAMTANAMMGDREKCLDAGMDDYMSKPLNRYILEKTLKKWDPLVQSSTSSVKSSTEESKPVSKEPLAEPKTNSTEKEIKPNKETPQTPTVEINQKWLSTKTLEDIKEFMGDEMVQLLEMFEQETPSILKKMQMALKYNNLDEVEKMAHMLKSTSANIGANGLSFFSRKLELGSNKGDKDELVATFSKIRKAYVLTSKEISKYIEIQ